MTCKEKIDEIEKMLNDPFATHIERIERIREIVDEAEDKTIRLDKIEQARDEISDWDVNKVMDGYSEPFRLGVARGLDIASEILDKLIEEVEDEKTGDHERTV